MADLIGASANTILIPVSTTASASVQLPDSGLTLRVVSEGPSTCFFAVGVTGVQATVPTATKSKTSTPVIAGSDVCFSIAYPAGERFISFICDTGGSARVWVQVSEGQ